MNILMIGPFPEPISGMTLANKMLYDGFIKEGHKVEIINTNTDNKISNLKKQGKFNLSKLLLSINPILKGSIKIILNKVDVVYITPAQSYIGFMKYTPFIKISKLMKKPCYLHFHGGFVKKMYDSLDKVRQSQVAKYLNLSDGVIVLGNSLRYMLEGIIPDSKIFVCENGVENRFFLQSNEFEEKIFRSQSDKKIRILYLSNLMKTKGILELLKACTILKDRNIDFEINIAGAIEPEIEKDVNEFFDCLKGNINYHGVVDGSKKRELLLDNEIFCLPTYYPNEGQPISILEAMATASAIVTTYQGGICDIFKDKVNGEVCTPEAENIADKIIEAKNKIGFYGENNYDIANKNYTDLMFVRRIEKIFKFNN